MKALVTGASGFVGSHLVEALRARGDEVTALVRTPSKARFLQDLGVRLVSADLSDAAKLQQAAAGQEIVFHVAGLVAARSRAEFDAANRDGTANLVAAIRRGGSGDRLILVSSMAAGGPTIPGNPLRGAEPPRPVTDYGRSKLAGEQAVRESDLAWTIVRPPMVYGPRDREVLRVFKLARWGVAPVFGDGSGALSAVYVTDLAAALIAGAVSPDTVGRTYYACHAEIFNSAEFVRAVARAQGRTIRVIPVPQVVGRAVLSLTGAVAAIRGRATLLTPDKANEFFQPAWIGDPSPLNRDSGWSAEHDLEAGLRKTAAWYRAHGWL